MLVVTRVKALVTILPLPKIDIPLIVFIFVPETSVFCFVPISLDVLLLLHTFVVLVVVSSISAPPEPPTLSLLVNTTFPVSLS